MAERRMFSKSVIDSDLFLDMPQSTQLLYFHLAMHGDDDGFINNPKSIMRNAGCRDDDMKLLMAKQFIIPFDSGVVVIKHWRIHNYIRSDRYSETKYISEKSLLAISENKEYELLKQDNGMTCGIPTVDSLDTQVRLGKDSIGKDSIGKNKKKKKPYLLDSYSKNEELISSLKDFIEMRKKIKAPMTERAVNLMLSKLSSMANDDTEKIKIINQSIMNSWKGIFPIKEEKRHDRFSARDDGEESIDWGAFDGA